MSNEPKIYIITINWNSFHDTKEFINSVLVQSYENYKIVVVDNNSSDDSVSMLKTLFPEVIWIIHKNNLGFSKACNSGIELSLASNADYVLILNNDTLIDKRLLQEFMTVIKNLESPSVISCNILNNSTNKMWYTNGYLNRWILEPRNKERGDSNYQRRELVEVEFISACCMFIPTSILKQVGLFDENFFLYYEDVDFCIRVAKQNIKLYCLNKILVNHHVSSAARVHSNSLIKFNPEVYYGRIKGKIVLLKKHYSRHFYPLAYCCIIFKIVKYFFGFLILARFTELRAFCKGLKEGIEYHI